MHSNINDAKGVFYFDGHSFDKVLFYGNENSIFSFEYLLFTFLLFTSGSFLMAILSIGVICKVSLNFLDRKDFVWKYFGEIIWKENQTKFAWFSNFKIIPTTFFVLKYQEVVADNDTKFATISLMLSIVSRLIRISICFNFSWKLWSSIIWPKIILPAKHWLISDFWFSLTVGWLLLNAKFISRSKEKKVFCISFSIALCNSFYYILIKSCRMMKNYARHFYSSSWIKSIASYTHSLAL